MEIRLKSGIRFKLNVQTANLAGDRFSVRYLLKSRVKLPAAFAAYEIDL